MATTETTNPSAFPADVCLKVKLTFTESVLGTSSANPDLHREYIASKAPDAETRDDEVAALGADAVADKAMTIFPKLDDGTPFLWDYQVKGFFKDACSMLKRVPGTKSSKIKAYKKVIDGLVFVDERKIPFENVKFIGNCQRPLRAQTAQGERVALAESEEIPAGATVTFTIRTMDKSLMPAVVEWLQYGQRRGIGQWRNSSKGTFTFEGIPVD